MHAANAYLNRAGERQLGSASQLDMLNMMLAGGIVSGPACNSAGERPEGEGQVEPQKQPDAFKNDPEDPRNPNEARERHLNDTNR